MEIIIYGVINSVILSLMALGFTLVYSIARVPNFAHGALYITTGYIAWLLMNKFVSFPYPLAIVISIGITALIGALIYRFVLIRIRGMEISEIIATYAIGLAILEGLRWGGLRGGTFTLPPFIAGSMEIFGVSIDYQRLLIVAIGIVTFASLYLFTHFNRVGLALRGIAQDERAAMMLGIDSDMTAIVSLAIGSGLAGFAAILLLPLGNIIVEQGYAVSDICHSSLCHRRLGKLGWYDTRIIHHRFCPNIDREVSLDTLYDGSRTPCNNRHPAHKTIGHIR